jgi:DNA-binding CsgD family transcriptional regulator
MGSGQTGSGHLRERDLAGLVEVIEDARRDEPGDAVPPALLAGLQRLIPCDLDISYQHHIPAERHSRLVQAVGPDGGGCVVGPETDPPDDPFWAMWWRSMSSWPQRSGDLRSVVHTGDFSPTERARRADPVYALRPEVRYMMIMSLPAAAGHVRRINFVRGSGPPFDERDRQVATLLRPHVQEVWLDAERRRRPLPRLTPREWEVLELAASGRSYAEIARSLFVSVGTVRKHMEHVRERLGVHSVGAAAALALPRPPDASGSVRGDAAPGPRPGGSPGRR